METLSLAREAIDDDALRGVLGADLRGKDLRYAIARGAFLVRADLTEQTCAAPIFLRLPSEKRISRTPI